MLGFQGGVSIPLVKGGVKAPPAKRQCRAGPKAGARRGFTGLAHLYNLVPYQRRAQHAGQCGVEVEGGRVPTQDWILNLHILTSGGLR
jgi:hypothetical protein